MTEDARVNCAVLTENLILCILMQKYLCNVYKSDVTIVKGAE
jgi:hypothetical protein